MCPSGYPARKAAGNQLSRTSSQSKLSGAAGHASSLDRIRYWIGPVAYRWPDHVHQVLSNRAQLSSRTEVLAPETHARNIVASDPIEARAKSDPIAAVAALRLLRRTRELTARHKLNAEEIEESVANQSIAPEAFDLASLAIQDASRLADELWTGNARAGRNFHDLTELLAGAAIEVPANEQNLKLILADELAFETEVLKIISSWGKQKEERALAE